MMIIAALLRLATILYAGKAGEALVDRRKSGKEGNVSKALITRHSHQCLAHVGQMSEYDIFEHQR